MKKYFLSIFVIFMVVGAIQAQFVFDPFEMHPDSNSAYIVNYASVSDSSWVRLSEETGTVHNGSAALRYDWQVERAESYGGFAKIELWNSDSMAVWNFAAYENLGIWYYNDIPSTDPTHVHLRIQLYDVSDAPINTYDAGNTELWYSFEYVLDDPQGWNQILLPLDDVGGAATTGSNGFWRTGWAGVTGNNTLDLDQIKGIGFEVSIDAPQVVGVYHSGSIIFDHLTFEGARALPVIFFNGKAIPSNMSLFTWSGSAIVEEGTGQTPGTNSIKWTQDPGQPWTGFGWNYDPVNLSLRWMLDSLKFYLKAPTGTGAMRAQFEDGTDKAGIVFNPIADDTWHHYAIPLRDMVYQDGSTTIDTSALTVFQFLAEGTGNGLTMNFDDIWTGNPVIDVIAPPPPTGVFVVPGTYSNLVTWIDVPNENGETYNLYYSTNPITDVHANGVDVVEMGLGRPENEGSWTHLLFSPLADSSVTYHYAVTCSDAAGNESDPALIASPVTNTAKGIATISLSVPANFTANSNLSEWTGIMPFRMFPSEGAHVVTNTTITDDNDLSVQAYLAGDATYFYFAFDVNDDVVDTSSTTSYLKDSPDLFIGLYNFHGSSHTAYGIGSSEPDYQLRFLPSKVIEGKRGDATVISAGSDYHWAEKFPSGYIIEGRFTWADLAAISGDPVFVPEDGYRIPLDFSINDADGGGVREGILTWSLYNDDTSWESPGFWFYTWVGTRTFPLGIGDEPGPMIYSYRLEQNYPNPFNPVTNITYTLQKQSLVQLDVYNTLGQKVSTLVNTRQIPGEHTIQFNGNNLASGIYFYHLKAGDFNQVKKMILMK